MTPGNSAQVRGCSHLYGMLDITNGSISGSLFTKGSQILDDDINGDDDDDDVGKHLSMQILLQENLLMLTLTLKNTKAYQVQIVS